MDCPLDVCVQVLWRAPCYQQLPGHSRPAHLRSVSFPSRRACWTSEPLGSSLTYVFRTKAGPPLFPLALDTCFSQFLKEPCLGQHCLQPAGWHRTPASSPCWLSHLLVTVSQATVGGPSGSSPRPRAPAASLPGLCRDSGSQAAPVCIPNPAVSCKSQMLFLKPLFSGVKQLPLSVHVWLWGHSTLSPPFQLLPLTRPAPCSLVLKSSHSLPASSCPELQFSLGSQLERSCRSQTV